MWSATWINWLYCVPVCHKFYHSFLILAIHWIRETKVFFDLNTKGHSHSPWPHIHHDIRKMFIALVWSDQQFFYLHQFHSFPFFFVYVKFQSINALLSYSIIMYYPYDIKLYIILYTKSSYFNSEVIMKICVKVCHLKKN